MAYFSVAKKKAFSKKYDFWKCVWKFFLDIPDILCRHLGCSPDLGLSFCNIRMVIRHFWRILSTENEKFSVFTKRYTDLTFCQPPKTAVFARWFFSKNFKKFSSRSTDCIKKVLLTNSMVENTSEKKFWQYYIFWQKSAKTTGGSTFRVRGSYG